MRRLDIPTFREMSRRRVAAIGLLLVAILVVGSLTYDKIPGMFSDNRYRAYFAEVGNLRPGDAVTISGVEVGKVSSIALDGNRVLVTFGVDGPVALRDATRAAIVTTSVLGKRGLKVTSAGVGELSHDTPIPLGRTTPPYSLTDALDDAGSTLSETSGAQLDTAIRAATSTLDAASPSLADAMAGVSGLSQTIGSRDQQLRELLRRTHSLSGVLADRSAQLTTLVRDATALLGELQSRRDELQRLIIGTRYLADQLSGTIAENQQQVGPALNQLRTVLGVLEKNRDNISKSIPGLRSFAMALGESVGTGPFFTALVGNLAPVAYLQPLVDAIVANSPPSAGPTGPEGGGHR